MALTDSLIAAWKMNEASGSRADSHGAHTLTENATSGDVDSAAGKLGSAANLVASNNEYLSRTDHADFDAGAEQSFTIATWVYANTLGATSRGIFSKLTDTESEYYLRWHASETMTFSVFGGAGNTLDGGVASSKSFSTGTWYFVVAWHDASANTVNIQINGGTVDSAAHSAGVYAGSGAVNIGALPDFAQHWDGRIDETYFWRRVLTHDERVALYNHGRGLAYPFTGQGQASQVLNPWSLFSLVPGTSQGTTTHGTMDATGESVFMVGKLRLESGIGTSRTFSSAGGRFYFRTGSTLTWADGGSTVRVGVQDMSGATFQEDGTFDVYTDVTTATALAATTIYGIDMANGSKTLTDGMDIAIGVEMTARGGVDAVSFTGIAPGTPWRMMWPGCSYDSGSGPTKNNNIAPVMAIRCDDGTMGWLQGYPWNGTAGNFGDAVTAFGVDSTPDEYLNAFRVKFPIAVAGLQVVVSSVASADDFELILYRDVFSSNPVAERTATVDADRLWGTGGTAANIVGLVSPFVCWPGVDYGVGVRATTTNTISTWYVALGTGNADLKRVGSQFAPATLKFCSRTNQTGAFAEVDSTYLPHFSLIASSAVQGHPVASRRVRV